MAFDALPGECHKNHLRLRSSTELAFLSQVTGTIFKMILLGHSLASNSPEWEEQGHSSPSSWTSRCSSNSTQIDDHSGEALPLFIVRSILDGQICSFEDFDALGVLLPIPTELRDETIRILLQQPVDTLVDKIEILLTMLQNGLAPLECDELGDTALHILAGLPGCESARFMSLLLQNNQLVPGNIQSELLKSIHIPNFYGNTALMVGVLYNNVEGVRVLLGLGACPETRGEFGKSALFFAVQRDSIEVVKLLLDYGARPSTLVYGTATFMKH